MFPINLAALATAIFGNLIPALLKLGLVGISFLWSSMCKIEYYLASMSFLVELIPERKRKLALYPVIIFYLFLSWFALVI